MAGSEKGRRFLHGGFLQAPARGKERAGVRGAGLRVRMAALPGHCPRGGPPWRATFETFEPRRAAGSRRVLFREPARRGSTPGPLAIVGRTASRIQQIQNLCRWSDSLKDIMPQAIFEEKGLRPPHSLVRPASAPPTPPPPASYARGPWKMTRTHGAQIYARAREPASLTRETPAPDPIISQIASNSEPSTKIRSKRESRSPPLGRHESDETSAQLISG